MTGGMDGTLRLWDIGKRAVIKVFATEHKNKYLDYEFHSSSIWSILPDQQYETMIWTGGKDGQIFEVDIENGIAKVLLKGNKPIICMANDEVNNKLWYGTPDSTIRCIEKRQKEVIQEEVFTKASFEIAGKSLGEFKCNLGLPELSEFQMMNNKRFVLTNNSAKQAELWEIETGQLVHQFD